MTHVFNRLLDLVTGHIRVTLTETERMLVLENGRFAALLGPGEHRLKRRDTICERHDIGVSRFDSAYERALLAERPDLVEGQLLEFAARDGEVLVISRTGGEVAVVLPPEARAVLWADAGPWEAARFDMGESLAVPPALTRRLMRSGHGAMLTHAEVPEGHTGMLSVDGVFTGRLAPGLHAFWRAGPRAEIRLVDMRMRSHEVTGQEILTRDRVTIRVNLTARYRVVDPEAALTRVHDFAEALHRALQLAFRRSLGALTLDRLLAEKGVIDEEAAAVAREEVARFGIELGEVALKDVILPGEMREILNRVVAAEKEAEASVIRRREETNATRALLNTARVMAENPVMLRLKELEALETIAGKVERLTVHNGTGGLMNDLVHLSD
ncbi:MAG: hypothetical protein CSA74_11765 [Rhodobacterales bacterium]|nr:MAG: hypothetical protein CSA74_11765 [Rhodobacterales bacterium]